MTRSEQEEHEIAKALHAEEWMPPEWVIIVNYKRCPICQGITATHNAECVRCTRKKGQAGESSPHPELAAK